MSRSYRHTPMMAMCGGKFSAHRDKQLAARGVRRAFRYVLHTTNDFEDFLPPVRWECSWNNTYSWGRDGRQSWHSLTEGSRRKHLIAIGELEPRTDWERYYIGDPEYTVWPPMWYVRMMRK